MIYLFQHYLLKNRRRKNLKIFFFIFILCKIISGAPLPSRKILEKEQIIKNQKMDEENRQFMQSIRLRALNNIQRSLESLSSLTANSLMLKTALQSSESIEEEKNEEEENEELNSTNKPLDEEEILTTFSPLSSIEIQTENKNKKLNNNKHHSGMRRIRADLRKIPLTSTSSYELLNKEQESEESTISNNILSSTTGPTRRLRSAVIATQQQNLKNNFGHYSHHQHHRRRRKGCPQIHGKDQLLCPTRNTYKYDVCITREQICDRIRDCPGGEDEDSRHCFFFRPLESSLKTLSHAVLLLVDTVMREQEIQHLEQRNEL